MKQLTIALGLLVFGSALGPVARAAETTEGFTEPYRTIRVAAHESGIVAKVLVQEGDTVKAGQPLIALDDDVHQTLLEIARQQMEATGRLQAALAECELCRKRLALLTELRSEGQAYQQEVERARTDAEMAEGRLLATREDLALRKLEYRKAQQQLERRTITAPMDGVVTVVSKNLGEFVSPVDPVVATLVQLHPLKATFLMSSGLAAGLQDGQRVTVRFPDGSRTVVGAIDLISPLIDAQSGTVSVKVRIENPAGAFRSGERCVLVVNDRADASAAFLSSPQRPTKQ